MNIDQLKKISSSANISVVNFHHVIFQLNIGKADILCRIYLPYIYQAPELKIITKDANITFGNITCKLFFLKLCFLCGNLTFNIGY